MRERWEAFLRRVRRFERREIRDLRRWLEQTSNLVHLSILLVVPLLLALVTALSNAIGGLSFLLYPPLASGAYTLFSNPEGEYASPTRFVGGLTVGALCGWAGVAVAQFLYAAPTGQIHAVGAALTLFFTGTVTWGLDLEEPAAFSTALLTLFVDAQIETPAYFVLSVAVSSTIVAGAFAAWRRWVYERRAQYLYESTSGDDHVLVPMRGPTADATAMLGARLAAAHRAGKVVLLDIVEREWVARAERSLLEEHGEARLVGIGPSRTDQPAVEADAATSREAISESVADLERRANDIETRVGVPCQVVVAVGDRSAATTVLQTAHEANCDLVATPYESKHGSVTPFVRDLFRGDRDMVVHRSLEERTDWKRILVPVRTDSDVAHNMIDFAGRLAGKTGEVSVATCIASEQERRRAEDSLADLIETFDGNFETRVSRSRIEKFLARHAHEYDLVIMGASQDRSTASRFISPPTFERIASQEIDTDVAIVDRY